MFGREIPSCEKPPAMFDDSSLALGQKKSDTWGKCLKGGGIVPVVNLDGVNSDAPVHGLQIPLTAIAANPSTVYVAAPQGVLQYSASAAESQQGWSEVPGLMMGGTAPVLPG